MATRYLKDAMRYQLEYFGDLGINELEDITAGWLKDLLVLDKLIKDKIEVHKMEETEERDIYYSIQKDGKEIANANMREYAIDAALKASS